MSEKDLTIRDLIMAGFDIDKAIRLVEYTPPSTWGQRLLTLKPEAVNRVLVQQGVDLISINIPATPPEEE